MEYSDARPNSRNGICGVMVSVLTSSAVVFVGWTLSSGQT